MIPLALTADEQRAYERTLLATHRTRTRLKLLDLAENELGDLSGRLLEGQINIDADAETSRQAQLELDDPLHSLQFDTGAPLDGALFADRMISVELGVYVAELGRWVDVPVFRGPISAMDRDGDSVALTCLGKEHLAKGACWEPLTLKRGAFVTDAITQLMRDRGGESPLNMELGDSKARLSKVLSLGRMAVPWSEARVLANAAGLQLFYDGSGTLRLTPLGGEVWVFRHGTGGSVLSLPTVKYDLSTIYNVVTVKGAKELQAYAMPPRTHPLSPYSMGREDAPRYIVKEIENDQLRTQAAAQGVADRDLQASLREGVSVDFDALPIPHLDVLDEVRLTTSSVVINFNLRKFSIPLTHAGLMSVGANRQVSPKVSAIRKGAR